MKNVPKSDHLATTGSLRSNDKKILFVYRTARGNIFEEASCGNAPDSQLFGFNHLKTWGYRVDFFDSAFSRFNPLHWLFYPLEYAIIKEVGMGFQLDQPTILLRKLRHFDVIVCTNDSAGLPFLLYKYLGVIKQPVILLSSGLAGALRPRLHSWVVKFYQRIMLGVDILAVYSKVENDFFRQFLKVPGHKIHYFPYGTDWAFFGKKSDKKRQLISAVGVDNGRDYKTFFAAVKNFQLPVVVACHPDNVKGLTIPDNVRCEFLAGYQRVREIFQTSKVVVVPCKERYRSAGQMVTLEASSARAPLIVSAIRGMTTAFDLKHRQHLLYVPPEDPTKLQKAISYLLHHQEKAESMANRASVYVANHYTSRHLAKNLLKLIDSF